MSPPPPSGFTSLNSGCKMQGGFDAQPEPPSEYPVLAECGNNYRNQSIPLSKWVTKLLSWRWGGSKAPQSDPCRIGVRRQVTTTGDAMRSKTLLLALVLVTGCLWAQEKKEPTPPATPAPTVAPATSSPGDYYRRGQGAQEPHKVHRCLRRAREEDLHHPMCSLPWG